MLSVFSLIPSARIPLQRKPWVGWRWLFRGLCALCALGGLLLTVGISLLHVSASPSAANVQTGQLAVIVTPTPTPTLLPTSTPAPPCGLAWRQVSSPNIGGNSNGLSALAALNPDDIWAVGFYHVSFAIDNIMIQHWDGSQWSIVASPVVTGSYLEAIVAISANDVWAVGTDDSVQSLTMHWNGTNWTRVTSPNMPGATNELRNVAAISTNDVWAVGSWTTNNGLLGHTLTMHWDGSSWTIVPSPNMGDGTNVLDQVTAISSNDVWAVGGWSPPNAATFTLALHWDGAQWSVVPTPVVGTSYNDLNTIAGISTNDIWAIGEQNDAVGHSRLLIEHWDGTSWSIIPSPSVNPNVNHAIFNMSAVSANDIWAAGYYYYYSGSNAYFRGLVLHWDGSQWSIVPSPVLGNQTLLGGVAALSTNDVWVTGRYDPGDVGQTIALHYSDPCLSVTPTPLPTNTPTSTVTNTVTNTATNTATNTPSLPTVTNTPLGSTPTATECAMNFSDVSPTDYFYQAVHYLFCAGVISGYSDGTFRPYNNTTRAQLSKIIVLARGWTVDCPSVGHFSDVLPGSTFYCFIETAYAHGIITGYTDGTFRPENNVTRGQLSKIIVLAMGWTDECPSVGHFSDVPPGSTFFCFIETAYSHGIITGYADGTFRPGNNATRGQISKIVYQAITAP